MSYCRFSTDDFQCDLYVYESTLGGYVTHVARTKVVFQGPLPEPVPFTEECLGAWLIRHKRVRQMLEEAVRVPLTLPHAGQTLYDETLDDLLTRLAVLKSYGYRFPCTVEAALLADNSLNPEGMDSCA